MNAAAGSLSALLDRVEHWVGITARWQAFAEQVGLLSYKFGIVDHTSKDHTAATTLVLSPVTDPTRRDTTTHTCDCGSRSELHLAISAHVKLVPSYRLSNRLAVDPDSTVNPYVDANAT